MTHHRPSPQQLLATRPVKRRPDDATLQLLALNDVNPCLAVFALVRDEQFQRLLLKHNLQFTGGVDFYQPPG